MQNAQAAEERTAPTAPPTPDQALLDEAFERALASWEEGKTISASELLPGRPDLADQAERIVTLAQEVAVTGPARAALPGVPGYTILSELGRGAMGAVYLACQERLGGRPVALKVLPAGEAISARARERFQAEANAIARLRHPHIVTVYDVVRDGILLAFAMEPVDGPSLHDVIDHLASRGGPARAEDVRAFLGAGSSALDPAPYWTIVARIGVAMARALQAVHDAGLLHRDVKPSNILLRRDGTPLLSDFGLVRDPGSGLVTQAGFVGTPAYAPPEQLGGGRGAADARSDVYALGATLYHALALRTPFAGSVPADVLRAAEHGPPSLRAMCPSVPRDLATIIAKAMAASARDRYATAGAMAEDLERLLAERPIMARRAGVVSRTVKLLRRNRQAFWGTAGGGIGVLLLVGGLFMGLAVMPRWAHEARERAWLALLDPRDTNILANVGFFEFQSTGPPSVHREVAVSALAEYERALRWQPWDERSALERDAIAAMLSLGEDGRSPPRLSARLVKRAPRACGWLVDWTRLLPDALPPPIPGAPLSDDELIAFSMMSYVTADMSATVEAWLRMEGLGDPGPFVRAGLGLFFIYRQEPGRAYPRLEDADRAFRTVSFLRAARAEAALGVGDTDHAIDLLEQAWGLPRQDKWQLLRVGTLIDLAKGDIEGGLERFAAWHWDADTTNVVAGHQVGLRLMAAGDLPRAVSAMAIGAHGGVKRHARVFIPLAERWWDGLSEAERVDLVEHAISTWCARTPWTLSNVPQVYWMTRDSIETNPQLADLRYLLRPHPLGECGKRLSAYDFHQAVASGSTLPAPAQGDALRQAVRAVLGLDEPR